MTEPIQSRTRVQIRQSIGRNLGMVIVSATTAAGGDTSSLVDTYGLQQFGDDGVNGRQVLFSAGSTVAASKSWVSDFDGTLKDATIAPVAGATIPSAAAYEMWEAGITYEDVNDRITQAEIKATSSCLQDKVTETTYTERKRNSYNCLSAFKSVHEVEAVTGHDIVEYLHYCNTAWDESTHANTTVSVDTVDYREGSGCNKFVVTAAVGGAALIATDDIASTDISDCDVVEMWFWSDTALTAGDYKLYLDNTASCASALETIDLPAITARTWTACQLTLANPELDTAIISVGLYQVTDNAAAITFKIDYIRAVNSRGRRWATIPISQWSIIEGSTPLLLFNDTLLAVVGDNSLLRISGYQIPTIMSADTNTSEIDPAYIIAQATADILLTHSKYGDLDPSDKKARSRPWLEMAEMALINAGTSYPPGTRWV